MLATSNASSGVVEAFYSRGMREGGICLREVWTPENYRSGATLDQLDRFWTVWTCCGTAFGPACDQLIAGWPLYRCGGA